MRAVFSKPVIINVTFLLLFALFSSGFVWSFYLQKANNETIDRFYRSTNWYANRMLYQSEKFLYQAKLYELNGIDQPELTKSYDLLWNRLQLFLEANSTELLRAKHPDVTRDVQALFDTIRSMESLFEQPQQLHSTEFLKKTSQVRNDLLNLNYSLSKVLSGTISQGIRTNNDFIQYWQLFAFIVSMVLALISFRLSRRSSKLAEIDPLTLLGNRRALTEYLNRQIKGKKAITLCAIDLKRFKQINDHIGYQIGDKVLVEFAERLSRYKKSQAFRLGGDEFVLVMPYLANQATLIHWVSELQQQLEFTYQNNEHQFSVAIRLGIADLDASIGNNHRCQSSVLLEQAIHALNETKQNADKDFAFYAEAIEKIERDREKRHALEQWIAHPEASCPLIMRSRQMYNTDSQLNEIADIYFTWKSDNSLFCLDWLAEHHLYLQALPKLVELAYCQQSRPILVRLQTNYQLEQLLKVLPKELQDADIIFGLPILNQVDDTLASLIHTHQIKIALENVIADHLIEETIVEYVRYWIPNQLPNTLKKQQAMFDLARAFNRVVLLPEHVVKRQSATSVI